MDKSFILLSFFQSIYIIYMLNYFKTKYSLSHPATYFENKLLYHPIGVSDKPVSNICQLGHILSWFLATFIIIRSIFLVKNIYVNVFKLLTLITLILGIVLSMMNFNAVVYLIPHFILEYYLLKKLN